MDGRVSLVPAVRIRSIHIDYETFCELDLRKVGLDRYSSHRSCRVLMAAYRINRGELQQWFCEDPMPDDLRQALLSPRVKKWAFNAQFERVITKRVLKLKTPRKGWRCSQVLAYMHCFAGGLKAIGKQMKIPDAELKMQMKDEYWKLLHVKTDNKEKIDIGLRLIKIFCMPNKTSKNQPYRYRNRHTDPELWKLFCEYNRQDVIAEEAILKRLRKFPIPEFEWELYELDQLINDRGIPVDMKFIDNVIQMSYNRKQALLKKMSELTGVRNPNSIPQIVSWLRENGYTGLDLRADTVKKVLADRQGLSKCLIKVLKLRQYSSLTSVNKAKTAKEVVGAGDCIRYMIQYGGASRTLRWAGRKVQTQNMKRTPKQFEDEKKLTLITDLIRAGNMRDLELVVSEPMIVLSGCMRSMFRCPDGEEFKTSDLKSIESAVIAWVTRCKRLLKVFADGRDPYKDFGREFYRKPEEEITSEERGICKPPALGCGFRLGPGKELENGKKTGLLGYAENMGVKMDIPLATKAVGVFREIYEEIPNHWKLYEKTIRRVMWSKKSVKVGPVIFERTPPYLTIRLPSGRRIYYFQPKIERKRIIIQKEKKGKIVLESYIRRVFTHWGRDNTPTGRNVWRRIESHGGVIIENIVQAIARDVLAIGMMRAHKAGFKIVGHAHDELIARGRVGDNRLTWQYLGELMSEPIDWAEGLPLGAAGWSGSFYRKA